MLAVAFISLSSTQSYAATLSAGFTYNAVNQELIDGNAGGLTWLKLSKTVGKSYDYISDKFDANEEFYGYRYATAAEVDTMLEHWVGSILPAGTNFHDDELMDDLILSYLGHTYGDFNSEYQTYYSIGLTADLYTNGTDHFYSQLYARRHRYSDYNYDYSALNSGYAPVLSSYSNVASFLVADDTISAVPLPAAFPLYGAGITVLGFIGWRKNRQS